jgi:hypothetical protein
MRVRKFWSGLTLRTIATLYLTLDCVLLLWNAPSTPAEGMGRQVFWVFVDAFLVYRIAKGSKGAWLVLLLLTALPILLVPFGFMAIPPTLHTEAYAALAVCLFQLLLLPHPAIRRRVGVGQHAAATRSGDSA